jgi:signal peptidase I
MAETPVARSNHAVMHPRRLVRFLWAEWIRPLALPLLAIAAAKSALADINYVPSGSMHPTLVEGDVVLVNKLAYDLRVPFTFTRIARWSNPERGDIVVCFKPTDGTRLVKRVVGLPGDTIEYRNEVLYINHTPLSYELLPSSAGRVLEPGEREAAIFATEQLGRHAHAVEALPRIPARRNFGPVTVPSGNYWLMGDNRDNSEDSRYWAFMPREKIIGRVSTVVASGNTEHWLRPRFDRFCSSLD